MRTYGRIIDAMGNLQWVEVTTDANGFNDEVYLTTLCQVLKLSRNESPFYANYGIPAQQAVMQQLFPDFYMSQTQQQFSPFFTSLTLAKLPGRAPAYKINVITHQGVVRFIEVPQ